MITHDILARKMAWKEPRKAVLYQTCRGMRSLKRGGEDGGEGVEERGFYFLPAPCL